MPVDRHPWTYKGRPESGGRLSPRDPATSSHPTHRGRLYVVGHGWLWLSGWAQGDGTIRLAADPMTSSQVEQYCAAPIAGRGSGRDADQANQAQQRAPHQAQLGALLAPADRAALASPARAAPADALEPARTPPGGASGAPSESRVSHTPVPAQAGAFENQGLEAKTAARVEVARAGRRKPDSKPSEEATAEGMRELNDDIPF